MTNLDLRVVPFLFAFVIVLGACPGVDGNSDAGTEPEPEPTCGPDGEPCTCETPEDEWPGSLFVDALDIFEDSGCTKVRGSITLTPAMLLRVSALDEVEVAGGLDIRGDFPAGTNLDELAFLQELRIVSVLGATGVTSLSGLENIATLDIGLHVEDAPDFVSIGMDNLRSIGISELGSRVVQEESVRFVNLPAFETLGLPDDYALEAGPISLQKLPNFDPQEAIVLITQYSELTDEERNPSPGSSPPTVICELDEAVGNGADRRCAD